MSGKYRRYIDTAGAGLHLNYQLYKDDWRINSIALGATRVQNAIDSFQIIPSIQYYSQREALFYETYATVGGVAEYITSN